MKYVTTIHQIGNNTGIEISEQQLEELGGGKKPLVVVTLNNHTYHSAVGKMEGKFLISLSAENRKKANVKGGDTLEVEILLDTKPRTVEVPEEFQAVLSKNKIAASAFENLGPSKRKAIVESILTAKTEETRQRRITKTIDTLSR